MLISRRRIVDLLDCDNIIEAPGAPATDGCNMLCAGNAAEICGGANRINVFTQYANYLGISDVTGTYVCVAPLRPQPKARRPQPQPPPPRPPLSATSCSGRTKDVMCKRCPSLRSAPLYNPLHQGYRPSRFVPPDQHFCRCHSRELHSSMRSEWVRPCRFRVRPGML